MVGDAREHPGDTVLGLQEAKRIALGRGGATAMIKLTRLNGKPFVVNAELIRTVEELPDTTIKLINGDHFIVKETMDEVIDRAIEYGRSLRKMLPPT